VAGADSFKNKTLPGKNRKRNEENCEPGGRTIVIPVVTEPIVVRVPAPATPVKVANVRIATRKIKYIKRHLCHRLLNLSRSQG